MPVVVALGAMILFGALAGFWIPLAVVTGAGLIWFAAGAIADRF